MVIDIDVQPDISVLGVAVEVRPGLFVVDPLLRAVVPGRGAVVDRKGGHGPENVLLPLDVDVVRDLRRKRFQERFVPALLAAQGVGLGREVFGLRESRAALAAAPEPDAGRDVGGVAPEDHGDLLPDDHDLRDRLFVDLHLDLDPSPESGIPVAFFKRFVAHVGDLQIDRVAENPVAAVDGHDTVEILLDGRAPQRVGLADDRDRSAQQRVVRLLVLDHDDRARRPAEVHEMGGDGEGLERMSPRRVCGGHADKPEKGENQ